MSSDHFISSEVVAFLAILEEKKPLLPVFACLIRLSVTTKNETKVKIETSKVKMDTLNQNFLKLLIKET